MGEKGDEFDTSYSIQTAEDKEYKREKPSYSLMFLYGSKKIFEEKRKSFFLR
jgi:hypothetical protein